MDYWRKVSGFAGSPQKPGSVAIAFSGGVDSTFCSGWLRRSRQAGHCRNRFVMLISGTRASGGKGVL